MQNQTSFNTGAAELGFKDLAFPLADQKCTSFQNVRPNQNLDRNPYYYYVLEGSFHYDQYFLNQYSQMHRNYWYQHQMNKISMQRFQDVEYPRSRKEQHHVVKIQTMREAEVIPAVCELIKPTKKYNISKKIRKNNSCYYWTPDQNFRYVDFLTRSAHLFSMTLTQRKIARVNVMMSQKVKTRTPQQCHSHHQKMMKKYGSIACIVSTMQPQSQQPQKRDLQTIDPTHLKDQIPKDQIKQEPKDHVKQEPKDQIKQEPKTYE